MDWRGVLGFDGDVYLTVRERRRKKRKKNKEETAERDKEKRKKKKEEKENTHCMPTRMQWCAYP